jgi:uncharacterized damage-inducible protein DinB
VDATTTALLNSLDRQRAHVLGTLEGLDAEALRKPVLPSGWNCLGVVQHLTLDVERFWFTTVMAGQSAEDASEHSSSWLVEPSTSADAVFDRYRLEIEKANAVITTMPLDAPPTQWPDFFGEWRLPDVRAVLLHVVTETACHAGHLDAVE